VLSVLRLHIAAGLLLASLAGCAPGDPGGQQPDAAWFREVAGESGLGFEHRTGHSEALRMQEIVAAGAALFDHDGDGDLDIYLTSGASPNRLFRQEAGGRFVDATAESGLGDTGYGIGVAVGDVDNDGDPDVYVSNFGADRLYINRGDGSFEDGTDSAEIRVGGFSTSAVFCDYDGDGFLDLYVARYVRWDPEQYCTDSSGQRDYCHPKAFNPAADVLLHNAGDGTFRDVTREAGLASAQAAGLGVICEDLDDDGRPDFYVANDQYANYLWVNRGDGTFEDRGLLTGAAYNLEGKPEAGMGVVAADLDGDEDLDLFVTHLVGQSNTLYSNLGGGLFEDATGRAGLAEGSLLYTGFGTVAIDIELDGDLDLVVANGRVFRAEPLPDVLVAAPWNHYAEPNLLFLNRGGGVFERNQRSAPALTGAVEVSRALATGDVDNDGDLDLLVANAEGPTRLYRNEAPRSGHWLLVRVVDPRLGRDAIGAHVTAVAGSARILRTVTRGFSYLSSNDPRVHFGLPTDQLERLEVRWPDGLREHFDVEGVDRVMQLERGRGRTP
jgi:hypothetical protein